jgi:hypothetical protein
MMAKHPNNGPTFSKPTIKGLRRSVPSPAKRQAEMDELARDAAKAREFSKDPKAWVHKHILNKPKA